jgi:hypothetical protein
MHVEFSFLLLCFLAFLPSFFLSCSPGSPLFDLSLDQLEAGGAEVLCFFEGIDPLTSNNIQARPSAFCLCHKSHV